MQTKTAAAKKAHEIKNPAIAFGVYGNGAKRLGDIAVTSKGLVWSNGASKASKDVTVKWDAFIGWMQSQLPAQKRTKKAAKTSASASANGKTIARSPKKGAAKKASTPKTPRKKVH